MRCLIAGSLMLLAAATNAHLPEDRAETALRDADAAWVGGSPGEAGHTYAALLEQREGVLEPFRSMLAIRLARARMATDDHAGARDALAILESLTYVPEHHALEATELRTLLDTGVHPGHQRTPIPPLPRVDVSIEVEPGGRTLQAALMEARMILLSGRTAEIVLAPGVYVVDKSLRLGPEDAGLVIRSRDPSEPAVLSGGVVLTQWQDVTDPQVLEMLPDASRDRVRMADLRSHGIESIGELVFGGFPSRRANPSEGHFQFASMPVPELFHAGQPQPMATWPDKGFVQLPVESPLDVYDARYARWAKETDLWMHGYWTHLWADSYEKVASIESDGTIKPEPPTNRYGFRKSSRLGRVVNALCELDQPGEWYLDTSANRVVYLPPDDFDPQQCVISAYHTPIRVDDCDNLQIRDLRLQFFRGDALVITDSTAVTLVGIDIQNCSGSGIRLSGGHGHLIHSCTIQSMGRSGIEFSAGDWRRLEPSHSIIENCRIGNLSRIDRTYTPGLLLEGMGTRVRHNAFGDIPSSAIRVESSEALIELNTFRRCVYESDDQGAIDMFGNPLYRGNIIRWNYFDSIINTRGGKFGAAAIRPDDFVSGVMIVENVMHRGSDAGFASINFNGGTDSFVEGNFIIAWHKAFGGWSMSDDWQKRLHANAYTKSLLDTAPWQSEAWQKRYPRLLDLFNGDDNRNYLVDNRRLGPGEWGGVHRALMVNNHADHPDFSMGSLDDLKPHVVPWRPIPLDRIGPYARTPASGPN